MPRLFVKNCSLGVWVSIYRTYTDTQRQGNGRGKKTRTGDGQTEWWGMGRWDGYGVRAPSERKIVDLIWGVGAGEDVEEHAV